MSGNIAMTDSLDRGLQRALVPTGTFHLIDYNVIAHVTIRDTRFRTIDPDGHIMVSGCHLIACDLRDLHWRNLHSCILDACALPQHGTWDDAHGCLITDDESRAEAAVTGPIARATEPVE